MLELLLLLAEGGEVILLALDGLAVIADVIAWIQGKPNRQQRKEAKASGVPGPKPDRWYWAVVFLTLFVILITVVLVIKAG